jgi:hypothetical protein
MWKVVILVASMWFDDVEDNLMDIELDNALLL